MSIDVFNPPLRSLSPASFGSRQTHLLHEIELEPPGRFTARRVRHSTLVVAFVIAGLIAAAAYAVVWEVVVGSPAPRQVKQSEQRIARGPTLVIPLPYQLRSRGMEVGKTTAAAVATGPAGPAYLWAAPNKLGGYCVYLQIVGLDSLDGRPNLSGGCHLRPDWVSTQSVTVRGRYVGVLEAHAASPGAHTLEVRFSDGSSRVFAIMNGYALAYVNPGLTVSSAVVRDALGRTLPSLDRDGAGASRASHASLRRAPGIYHGPRKPPTPAEQRAANNALIQMLLKLRSKFGSMPVVATLPEIGTHRTLVGRSGPLAAPGQPTQLCWQLTVPGQGKDSDCERDPLRPNVLDIGPASYGAAPNAIVVLWGPVGADIHSLELSFQDGSHTDIPIHHGYVLYQVNPKSYANGHQPTTIVARDANGKTVATRAFWG